MIGELVEPFQFVFNPGRQLVEGVIIGGRILATWKREGRMECMWKVNLQQHTTLSIGTFSECQHRE